MKTRALEYTPLPSGSDKMKGKNIVLAIFVIAIVGTVIYIEKPFQGTQGELGIIPQEVETGTKIGDVAPNFVLETIDGKRIKLSSFRGKKAVFINFWATWCPFCIEEMPDIQRVSEEFEEEMVVLGINRAESIDQMRIYLDDFPVEMTYPTLKDPEDVLARAYNVRVMPTSYFIDKEGIIREKKLGFMTIEEMREKILETT